MTDFQNFDWSPSELYSPIWIEPNFCVCLEGIPHPRDSYVIRLRRSMVFGTGGHPATRAMLIKLLHKELDEGIRVIDFWCGSGLLGIVCAKFGCEVNHMDDNKEALVEAIENGLLNECAVAVDEKKETTKIAEIKPADLLVTHQAQLEKLKRDIPTIHKLLKQGGTFLLSGWSTKDHKRIKSQVEEFFQIEEIQDLENWPIITARK